MPTPTTRLRAVKLDPGSDLNTWGLKLNTQAFDLLDEAVAGVERVTLSANTYTLSSANYATDQARNAGLIFTGTPTAPVAVTIPAVEKVYTVVNDTAQTITLGCGGTVATLPAGDRAVIWCDGTDCGLGSISADTVNGLILAASLSPGTLPGQAGNSGKFLSTNGTAPLWSSLPDVGGGADATLTTSTALTASAAVVQSVDMATNAQSVTLPDATTLTKGGRKYVIANAGNRTFGVRSNGGALLTVVPAGAVAEMHLRDNGTAAGSWAVTGRGLEPALALVDHTAPTTITGAVEAAVRLTDTLSLHFGTTASGFNALAVDSTAGAGTAGTWTAVETAGAATVAHAFRMSDTTAIVFWTQSTNHKAAVLTVSGTTISVGTAASTTTAFLTGVTFSGRPLIAQLTSSLYVSTGGASANGGTAALFAVAVSVSGTTVTIGASAQVAASSANTSNTALAVYRVSDTTALEIHTDDSGTAGSPFSLRASVLSVSGTTVTVGTSNGVNDVQSSTTLQPFPTCQLTATKYLAGYVNNIDTSLMVVAMTVSGTSVSVGTPLSTDPASMSSSAWSYTSGNASRFAPNLARLDDSRALVTFGVFLTSNPSRHAVLTESGGALTAGTVLYSLWPGPSGGNFPQAADGFLAFALGEVYGVTVSGTSLVVGGAYSDGAVSLTAAASARFGLSGGVRGVQHDNTARSSLFHLFRFVANAPPRYLGPLRLGNIVLGAFTPVEVAASKVAIIASAGASQPTSSGENVRLLVVEFASA